MVDAIAHVLRFAFDVALGGPFVAALHFEREMNVPYATGVKDGLDRAEVIFAR